MTDKITASLDLNIGEQEVLKRILAQPDRIAKTLAAGDVHEEARLRGVMIELAGAFAQGLIEAMDRETQAAERDQGSLNTLLVKLIHIAGVAFGVSHTPTASKHRNKTP